MLENVLFTVPPTAFTLVGKPVEPSTMTYIYIYTNVLRYTHRASDHLTGNKYINETRLCFSFKQFSAEIRIVIEKPINFHEDSHTQKKHRLDRRTLWFIINLFNVRAFASQPGRVPPLGRPVNCGIELRNLIRLRSSVTTSPSQPTRDVGIGRDDHHSERVKRTVRSADEETTGVEIHASASTSSGAWKEACVQEKGCRSKRPCYDEHERESQGTTPGKRRIYYTIYVASAVLYNPASSPASRHGMGRRFIPRYTHSAYANPWYRRAAPHAFLVHPSFQLRSASLLFPGRPAGAPAILLVPASLFPL